MSHPDSRSDPIGRSEPGSGVRDYILGLFTYSPESHLHIHIKKTLQFHLHIRARNIL